MLEVKEISKTYGKLMVLNNLSFSVQQGEIVGLVGENGAGKSTLLSILAMMIKPTSGSIYLFDNNYNKKKKFLRKRIGFVPQDIAVWEDFTVEENMIFFERLSWVKKSKEELYQLCLDMKLDEWKTPVKRLSGGMKRKLNLAISLIHEPDLILLDEPTVGIDLKSRKEIGVYLKKLAEKGKMILYTSHDMDEIIHLCDYILCIGRDSFYPEVLTEAGKTVITFPIDSSTNYL